MLGGEAGNKGLSLLGSLKAASITIFFPLFFFFFFFF